MHVRELSWRQTAAGHRVHLLYRVGGEPDWPFESTPLPAGRQFSLRAQTSAFVAEALAMVARNRRDIDVVHFHGDYFEAIAAGVVRLLGIPSLLTLHGRLSPRVLRTLGFVYRLPSHIVAVSPAIASQLAEAGVSPMRVTVQPSGVNREMFFPSRRRAPMPPFCIIVASTLIALKDHGTVFEAVQLLQDDGLDVRLEIAGTGGERDRLERLAPPNTVFHGQLERPRLGGLMRGCHAAALASIDTPGAGEGTPTFLMEAIACGLPFVATEIGGVPRLAARSGAGLVVPQRDVEGMASALHALVTDRKVYDERRRAAVRFGPRLDWDVVAERLDALMSSLAASAEPASIRIGDP